MEEKIKEDTFKIGDLIHTLRTRNTLKQEELAIMTGLHRSVISAHETGRRTPTKYHIQKYNEAFGYDITEFAPLEKKMPMTSRSIRLPEQLYSEIKREAEKNEMDVSQYIRMILEKGIHEEYITKSMDTIIVMIQEAVSRAMKKDIQHNREIPIQMLECIYMIKYLMRESLHLSSIEIDTLAEDIRHMAREDFYRRKGKGDS